LSNTEDARALEKISILILIYGKATKKKKKKEKKFKIAFLA